MLANIKQTVKHTASYGIGNIAPKLIGFVLLPLYTELISVSDYGILGLFELLQMMSVHVLSMGMPPALMRSWGLASTEVQRKQYAFQAATFLVAFITCALAVVLPFRGDITTFFFNKQLGDLLVLLAVSVTFTVLNKVALTLLRAEQKSRTYAAVVVVQFTLNLAANIYFVAVAKLGIKGVLISQAASSTFIFVFLLPYLARRVRISFDLTDLKRMLKFGFPLIFAALAASVLNWGDRYILSELASFKEVGLYTLGYKFSNSMKMLLVDAFALGLPAIGWRIVKEGQNPQRFFSKTLTYLVFCLLWCGLALSAFSKGILHLLARDQAYWDAYVVVPVLVLGIVFTGMQAALFFLLQIPKKTHHIAFIISGAAAVNIGLNLWWIPGLGILGAALATLGSQLGSLFFSYLQVQKIYPVRFEKGRIAALFAVALTLYFACTLFDQDILWQRIAGKGGLILSFPFLLYLFRFYEPVELARIRAILNP